VNNRSGIFLQRTDVRVYIPTTKAIASAQAIAKTTPIAKSYTIPTPMPAPSDKANPNVKLKWRTVRILRVATPAVFRNGGKTMIPTHINTAKTNASIKVKPRPISSADLMPAPVPMIRAAIIAWRIFLLISGFLHADFATDRTIENIIAKSGAAEISNHGLGIDHGSDSTTSLL